MVQDMGNTFGFWGHAFFLGGRFGFDERGRQWGRAAAGRAQRRTFRGQRRSDRGPIGGRAGAARRLVRLIGSLEAGRADLQAAQQQTAKPNFPMIHSLRLQPNRPATQRPGDGHPFLVPANATHVVDLALFHPRSLPALGAEI